MDQFQDLLSLERAFYNSNISRFSFISYNFTDVNSILQDFKDGLYTLNSVPTIVLVCLYVPVFLVALFGNILIILSVTGDSAANRPRNYFLLNLALADLAVAVFCMPTSLGMTVL